MPYSNYLFALEQRAKWLHWCQNIAPEFYEGQTALYALPMYEHGLRNGETFFMSKQFCELVDMARVEIPDNLKFDPNWMIAKNGFMWLETPFRTPVLSEQIKHATEQQLTISAIAWFELPPGIESAGVNGHPSRKSVPGTFQFIMFHAHNLLAPGMPGFGCWSYFSLQPGDEVLSRVRDFEAVSDDTRKEIAKDYGLKADTSAYAKGRDTDLYHEVRWTYTAIHLMSQKLASTKKHAANRPVRRRLERDNVPLEPFYRLVTLRRLAEEQEKHGAAQDRSVEWQWQWRVHGHGRWQWFPSIQDHKYIWIEDYIKGPTDKPLKPEQTSIYIAKR